MVLGPPVRRSGHMKINEHGITPEWDVAAAGAGIQDDRVVTRFPQETDS
jgi:hypothetical protein